MRGKNHVVSAVLQTSPPTGHHWEVVVDEMLRILRTRQRLLRSDDRRLQALLRCCPADVRVATRRDAAGCDLVRWCVTRDSHYLLQSLLERVGGAGRALHWCGADPLLLACRLDRPRIAALLLTHSADTSRSTAHEHLYAALLLALRRDHPDVVAVLLHAKWQPMNFTSMISQACRFDAYRSLSYLLCRFRGRVAHEPTSNYASVLCKAFEDSERCGLALLSCGVPWPAAAFSTGRGREGLLHTVYRSVNCHRLLVITRAAFEATSACPGDLLSSDTDGNSPLHVLTMHVSRRTDDDELVDCVKYLLAAGVDVNERNKSEMIGEMICETALHRLLCADIDPFLIGDPHARINRVLEALLVSGADVTASAGGPAPPLTCAVRLHCQPNIDDAERNWPAAQRCLQLLCQYGADPHVLDAQGIAVYPLLLTAANRWLAQCGSDTGRATALLLNVRPLLATLLTNTGDRAPPIDVVDVCCKQVSMMCNTRAARLDPGLLRLACSLLIEFVTRGVDASLLSVVADTEETTPCKLNARFHVAYALCSHDSACEVLSLFEATLSQSALTTFVSALQRILQLDFTPHCDVVSRLQRTTNRPRPLLCLARLTVCQAMQWRLHDHAARLPLPQRMQRFVRFC